MDLLLGIDVGTTNCKAVAYNERGEQIVAGKTATITKYEANGRSYYEPAQIWESVVKVINDVITKLNNLHDIVALSVTCMGEAGVPIDQDGNPIYPIITWFDSRSLPQSQELERRIGNQRIFEITGLDNNPIFSVPKIMWLKDNEPEIYARMDKWLCVSDYIYFKMTNQLATDFSIASRTMALDITQGKWSEEILNRAGLKLNLFSPLVASGTVVGAITHETAFITGLTEGTPVVVGGHDHYCGSLASGIMLGGRIADSSGTAESIHSLLTGEAPPTQSFRGFRIGRYLDPSHFYIVGGIVASGASIDWAMKHFYFETGSIDNSDVIDQGAFDRIMRETAETPPGAKGLLFLPHLRGGGAPSWDPRSRAAFVGLQTQHKPAEMMRAVIEGLCFEVRNIIEDMREITGNSIEALTTVGGGARNRFWQQTKADVTGVSVEIPDVDEATALGAALLAGIGIGIYRDMIDASRRTHRVKMRFEPSREKNGVYNQIYQIYTKIYPSLKSINIELDGFSR